MRRAIPYPWRGPRTSRVFSTISASVPCRMSVSFIEPLFGFPTGRLTYALWESNRAARSYTELGLRGRLGEYRLFRRSRPELLKGARVSANFLRTLGVEPMLGGEVSGRVRTPTWQTRFRDPPDFSAWIRQAKVRNFQNSDW